MRLEPIHEPSDQNGPERATDLIQRADECGVRDRYS
jgi:hypothetical protein